MVDKGDYMPEDFEVEKNAMIDFQEVLDELRRDRDERDEHLASIISESRYSFKNIIKDINMAKKYGDDWVLEEAKKSFEENKHILDALGSDYDEDGVPYWDKWTSKQIGDDFEKDVLKDLEERGFNLISRNVHMKGTGCEVDFLARNDSKTWHVEAKGGKPGSGKRPGAQRTDNVKKAVANAALIKAVYKDVYFVVYFSSRPKLKTYSREMIDTARAANLFDEVIYLDK